jgi:hypothetical protein
MKIIIRDEEGLGIFMIPLLIDWHIKRCNIKDCTEEPNTIITGTGAGVFGLCEKHFQECNQSNPVSIKLEFNDFDAFEFKKQQKKEHDLELLKEMRKEMIEDDADREDEIHNARYGN